MIRFVSLVTHVRGREEAHAVVADSAASPDCWEAEAAALKWGADSVRFYREHEPLAAVIWRRGLGVDRPMWVWNGAEDPYHWTNIGGSPIHFRAGAMGNVTSIDWGPRR